MYVGFFVFVLGIVVCSCSTIPSYIPVCKRNDPKIEECIIKAIETLKPKLMKGIPELDIPALEPLVVPELIISRGGAYKAIGRNLVVKGASNFKVTKLKADIINIKYLVSVTIPKMDMEADYEVDAKILNLKFNGKGKIRGNATDAKADVILSGKKAKRDGKTYADFTGLEIDLKLGDYSVQIDNLFNGNKELGDAINIAVNENKKEFMKELKPTVEQVLEKLFLDVAQKITSHFTYDDLFPVK